MTLKDMNRKQRRKAATQARKSGNKDIEEKMKLFSKMKDKCKSCEEVLDKSDIKMISEWMVIVREDEGKVNLYCPACWDKAKKAVKFLKELDAKKKD